MKSLAGEGDQGDVIVHKGKLDEQPRFTSLDVSVLTKVSLRQLQWWDEQGLVSPRQSGHRRLYTKFEVLQVSLINGLRKKGISLQKIRPLLGRLSLDDVHEAVNHGGRAGDAYFLTDGEEVYLEHSPASVVKIVLESDLPVTALNLSAFQRGIEEPDLRRKPVQSATESTGYRHSVATAKRSKMAKSA